MVGLLNTTTQSKYFLPPLFVHVINTEGLPFLRYCSSRYHTCMALCRGQLKCDGTRAETRFRLSAKRTSPFKSAGGRQFNRLLAAEVCASAVVMLDTPCSEVVFRALATHSIRQFPLHFPSRSSPCAITFWTGVYQILFHCMLGLNTVSRHIVGRRVGKKQARDG